MPFLSHGSYRIRYELDGPANAPAYVLVNGLTQYAELWAAYRDALVGEAISRRNIRSARPGHFRQAGSVHQPGRPGRGPCSLDRRARRRPRLSQRHQLRRPDRAPLCHYAWQAAVRTGADELLRGAVAATPAARQRHAHRADPRRHQLSAGSAAADEPVRSMAEAVAGQARQREAAGLAGQRRLRPAEPDGILPRLSSR